MNIWCFFCYDDIKLSFLERTLKNIGRETAEQYRSSFVQAVLTELNQCSVRSSLQPSPALQGIKQVVFPRNLHENNGRSVSYFSFHFLLIISIRLYTDFRLRAVLQICVFINKYYTAVSVWNNTNEMKSIHLCLR